MKKFRLIALFAAGTLFFSCDDARDIVQDGEFNEDATFRTVDDMDQYLTGTYSQLTTTSEIAFTSIFTDEVGFGPANAGQNLDLYKLVLNNNNGNASSIWLSHYSAINYSNRLLKGAATITPSAADLSRYNSIIAEAKVIRAFCHLQLMSYFAEDMTDDSSLGVILMDRVPDLQEQLPRNTTGEVFALIESDLDDAEASIVDRTGANAYFYASKNLIYAIRARMYAYRGNYPAAEAAADWVINNSGLSLASAGSFTTATTFATGTTSPYRAMWVDTNRGEIIWGLSRFPGDGAIAGVWTTNATTAGGSVLHDMGRNLFNLLNDQDQDGLLSTNFQQPPTNAANDSDDRDVRVRSFIDRTATIRPDYATVANYKQTDNLTIDKYPGKLSGPTGFALTNDLKVFRLSEMFFIKMEARAAAGDLATVATMLKDFRDQRTMAGGQAQPLPSYSSATLAWADILLERRKELCFEGHRYIDLRRLGALAGGVSINRYERDCSENAVPVCELQLDDHRYVLPIPIDEIIGNSAIQQNPEY